MITTFLIGVTALVASQTVTMQVALLSSNNSRFATAPGSSKQIAAPSSCRFKQSAAVWLGGCGKLFRQVPRMTLSRARSITSGSWRADVVPLEVWAGTMTDSGYPDARIELEVYAKGAGVLRTTYKWLPVSAFTAHDSVLSFEVDTLHAVQPNDVDRAIVQRANALLSSNAVWNRNDNRECPANATVFSIYCAMERAAQEITGGTHHRRPAMELVRMEVERRSAGRNYEHRLMGYNNDSTTKLSDVRDVFAAVLAPLNFVTADAGSATATVPLPSSSGEAAKTAGNVSMNGPPAINVQEFTSSDVKIVERTQQILGASATWNQKDGQDCKADAPTFGLYCALRKASQEVTGNFDHDSPVLNETRTIIDFVAARKYGARLVDYNNDSTTTLIDVQELLRILHNRIARKMAGESAP